MSIFFNKVLLQNLTFIIDINDFGPFQFNHMNKLSGSVIRTDTTL